MNAETNTKYQQERAGGPQPGDIGSAHIATTQTSFNATDENKS